MADFLATGQKQAEEFVEQMRTLGYPLSGTDKVLDFGCGAGRLTRALSKYFRESYGVDISEKMVALSREMNHDVPNCHFMVNSASNLAIFSDNYFDCIYTVITLQHVPRKFVILYIEEFLRILKKGGVLAFQLPSFIPLRNRFMPRRRLYLCLRKVGLNSRFLYERLNLNPIRVTFIRRNDVVSILRSMGAEILEIQTDSFCGPPAESHTYFVTK
jgi:ubiquinone/menaquinone biosynthesis C-methylase UbiE